jgi:LacI family transcriptional regulator
MAEVNLKKIAEEAGVSITLVSLVLNNKKSRVSKITKQRIIDTAKKYNYVPNRLASGLKSKKTHIIAILAPFTPSGFFSELIYYIEQRAIKKGYIAVVINTFHDPQKEEESLNLYKSNLYDGMLISVLSNSSLNSIYHNMQESKFPFVFIDRYTKNVKAAIVSSDHYKVSFDMTIKALTQGNKNILFLYRKDQVITSTAELRKQGYEDAMKSSEKIPLMQTFSIIGEDTQPETNLCEKLNQIEELFDSIFLYSGYYMSYFLEALNQSKLKDIKLNIFTVDSINLDQKWLGRLNQVERLNGHFVTVIQDIKTIAETATDRLVDKIENKIEFDDNKKIFIPTKYFEG